MRKGRLPYPAAGAGADRPLEIEDYELSEDLGQLLIFTNTERVWRRNTRGDYWVFDLQTGELHRTWTPREGTLRSEVLVTGRHAFVVSSITTQL